MSKTIDLEQYSAEGDMVAVLFCEKIKIMSRDSADGYGITELCDLTVQEFSSLNTALKEAGYAERTEEFPARTEAEEPHDSFERITDSPEEAAALHELCDNPPAPTHDPVNHPDHYCEHPSGVECIQITEHMNFNCGNAMKYIWRHGLKGKDLSGCEEQAQMVQDLEKAVWYLHREIDRLGEL